MAARKKRTRRGIRTPTRGGDPSPTVALGAESQKEPLAFRGGSLVVPEEAV